MGNKLRKQKKVKEKESFCCDSKCIPTPLGSYEFDFQYDCWRLTEKHLKVLENCLKVHKISDVIKIIESYLNTQFTLKKSNAEYNCQSLVHNSLYKTSLCNQIYNKFCEENGGYLRIVILGNGGVGKSSITIRYVQRKWANDYWDPTIEDTYRAVIPMRHRSKGGIALDILDTASREEYAALRDMWIRQGQVFIIVYSINSQYTLQDAIRYNLESVLRIKEDEMNETAIIIVANKIDLRDNKNEKFVENKQGMKAAIEYKIPYIETSAKRNVNIDYLFNNCIFEYMYQTKVPMEKRICNIKLG